VYEFVDAAFGVGVLEVDERLDSAGRVGGGQSRCGAGVVPPEQRVKT
jgi:hypothetical protein